MGDVSRSDKHLAATTPRDDLLAEFHRLADRVEQMSEDAADEFYEAASLRYEVWMERDRG